MDGCLGTWNNTSQWGNIHQQNLDPNVTRSEPNSMLDPINHEFQRIQNTINNSQASLMGGLPWDESLPSPSLSLLIMNQQLGPPVIDPCPLTHVVQPQLFDGSNGTTSGSIGLLLSATNSNTDTTNSIEDDGVSMMTNQQNMWNFSSSKSDDSNHRKRRVHIFDDENIYKQVGGDHGFKLIQENMNTHSKGAKRAKLITTNQLGYTSSNNISFQHGCSTSCGSSVEEPDPEAVQQMKEMIYRMAAFRPVNFGAEVMEKPKRKNVRISSDPQTVAARHRRERISERLSVLQKIVPGGSKMDTASMLDEAANYLKFLRNQVKVLEALGNGSNHFSLGHNVVSSVNHSPSINLQFSIPTIDPHATATTTATNGASFFIAKP